MIDSDERDRIRRKWFRFGIVLAILYATFTLVLFVLFKASPRLGVLVGVVGGTVGAVVLTIFVLYVYREDPPEDEKDRG